jgi:hypothetical protein
VTTDIAFELWLLRPPFETLGVELECIYRRKEDGVGIIDFLHVVELDETISASSNKGDDSNISQ